MGKLIEKILSDAKVAKQFAAMPPTSDEEQKLQAFIRAANDNGYAVTPEEISAELQAAAKLRVENEAAAQKAVEEIPLDELDNVAGGKGHPECQDTFKSHENCWFNDGCDHVTNEYSNYLCHYGTLACDELFKEYE